MKRRSIRFTVAVAAFASMVVATSNMPVQADEFIPLPGPPEVIILGSYTTSITPANPVEGGTLVTVQATVETNALLDDLSTVTLCMYKTVGVGTVIATAPSASHSATSPCGFGSPNAANSVEIVWTEDATTDGGDGTGGFSILDSIEFGGSNQHKINGSTACTSGSGASCVYDAGLQFVTLTFKFYVSYALLAGTDWNYHVSAEIPDSVCGGGGCSSLGIGLSPTDFQGSDEVGGVTVDYYGEVLTAGKEASDSDYGYLQDGQTSLPQTFDEFEYLTNGLSLLTLHATDFVRAGGDALTLVEEDLATAYTSSPASAEDKVALSCRDSSGTVASYVPRTTAPTPSVVELDYERDPTIEVATSGSITCELTYGGGADVALATYSSTVTVGVADAR